ncbi:hypothetical protein [Vibrio phage vB_VhaP_PG11]|nr:hypothetical protein [Vibrio phage vB_VhaP_PG11]
MSRLGTVLQIGSTTPYMSVLRKATFKNWDNLPKYLQEIPKSVHDMHMYIYCVRGYPCLD